LRPAAFIYTDIHLDGMQTGPNITATRRLAQAVAIPVIASGGVDNIKDIENLIPLKEDGVVGVITGKALYAGTLDFQEALRLVARSEK
jgi:phosphoribosylformimino-5-aminoimidazole carboxamide ribotide isomerase